MEGGQGEVSPGSADVSSELHLCGNSPIEGIVENIGSENQVVSLGEEDEGEIMVEVVGSHVFVDGVGGPQAGDLRSGENGNVEAHEGEDGGEPGFRNFSEREDVSEEGNGNMLGGVSESRVEKDYVRTQESNAIVEEGEGCILLSRGAGAGLSNDGVWNPGIEAVIVISSAGTASVDVQIGKDVDGTPVINHEEKTSKYAAADDQDVKVAAGQKSDLTDKQEEAILPARATTGMIDCMDADSRMSYAETNDSDTVGMETGKCTNVAIEADTAENQPKRTCLTSNPEEDIIKAESAAADSGLCANNLVVSKEVLEVIDDQNTVSGEGFSEKGEKSVSGTFKQQTLQCQENSGISAVDASCGIIHLSPKGLCSQAEKTDSRTPEDGHLTINVDDISEHVAEKSSRAQSLGQEVSEKISETSNHVAGKLGGINLIENEFARVGIVCDITEDTILPEATERDMLHDFVTDVGTSTDEAIMSKIDDDTSTKIEENHNLEKELVDIEEEPVWDRTYHTGIEMLSDLMAGDPAFDTDKYKLPNEEIQKSVSFLKLDQLGYLSPSENEGCFAISDLVWGKVRSHPWWPGQIFDTTDASETALKYSKKDSYLVAYFGDRTFAWNDSSVLKPFRSYFSQMGRQSNSEAFRNAVNCALEEVSRRVELGLSCSCVSKDVFDKVGTQVVENTGIREDACRRYGVDASGKALHFEPVKLLAYIRELAPIASSGVDRLDLTIAQAQLSAFCHFKGYRLPAECLSSEVLLEDDLVTQQISDETTASEKFEHTPADLPELMGDWEFSVDVDDDSFAGDVAISFSPSLGRKRKAPYPVAAESAKRTFQTPRTSFKIGECISRVASQLTGSTSLGKVNEEAGSQDSHKINEQSDGQSMAVSAESSSISGMLSRLQVLALQPRKEHNFARAFHTFFLGYRNSITLNRRVRKKKSEATSGGTAEEFEFDDVNDSYWTDRIVQNYSQEQLLHNSVDAVANLVQVPFDALSIVKPARRQHSRKRFSNDNYESVTTASLVSDENVKRQKQGSSPAELILNFTERKCIPSEINLNKILRRFGPLMESETEVDHASGRAKVIFKRGFDAEVACDSSEKFNIFGPGLVTYEVGYTPLISVKILPLALPGIQEDALLFPERGSCGVYELGKRFVESLGGRVFAKWFGVGC